MRPIWRRSLASFRAEAAAGHARHHTAKITNGRNYQTCQSHRTSLARAWAEKLALIEISPATQLGQRPIGWLGYAWMWVGMANACHHLFAGRDRHPGLQPGPVLLIIAGASLAVGAMMPDHRYRDGTACRTPPIMRAAGIHGASLRSRGVVAAMWFSVDSYLGAICIYLFVVDGIRYFMRWSNWFRLVCAVPGVLQVASTAPRGSRSGRARRRVAAPAIIAISVWMYFAEGVAATKGREHLNLPRRGQMSALVCSSPTLGYWSALTIDIPNWRATSDDADAQLRRSPTATSLCCFSRAADAGRHRRHQRHQLCRHRRWNRSR